MMTYAEAVSITEQLVVDRGRGFDWTVYPLFRYEVSEDAKHLAIKVLDAPNNTIPDPSDPNKTTSLIEALRVAIGIELGCNVHRDYVYRVLALVLDDDVLGRHITKGMLIRAKAYRMQGLGMSY